MCLLDRQKARMFADDVILEQSWYPGPMGTIRAGIERLHLAEEVHVLPQAAPVAVPLITLQAAQIVLTTSPNVAWQFVAE